MSNELEQAADKLDTLSDKLTKVSLRGGQEVSVHTCKLKNISPVLRVVSKVLNELGLKDLGDGKAEATVAEAFKDAPKFLQSIANVVDELSPVMSNLSSLTEDEVSELSVDDLYKLGYAIFEVNKDFFLKSVLPLLPNLSGSPATETANPQQ